MSVFFIADLHLGHKNIIYFRDKPYVPPWERKLVKDPKTDTLIELSFQSSEEHDQYIIDAWNKKVSKRDTVWIPGDVAFTNEGLDRVSELNGTKNVVLGNHDVLQISRYYKQFNKIAGAHAYKKGVITHVPILKDDESVSRWEWNIHGHLHQHTIDDPFYINVSADQLEGLAPISLDELRIKYPGVFDA
jgi:calcineurin-like phosphoesterase family protein